MVLPLSRPSRIVLTGATSGIGACLRERLLAQGHQVIAVSRGASDLHALAGLETIVCDMASPEMVRAVAKRIRDEHEHVDCLINNAALQYAKPLMAPDFEPEQMIAEANINLLGPALLSHALLPALQSVGPGAAIVNISSGLAFYPKRETALYCATKAALHSFSQSLRYQLEGSDVRVIEAILPLVATPMTEGRGQGKISAEAAAKAILDGIARGKREIYIGKAKLLPLLSWIAPAIPRRMLRDS